VPKVSIIMPVYNGAQHIREAIASVFAQTYTDWELIVVDDGSTDDTVNVVASLGVSLTFLKQQNHGPSAARNLGLHSATGSYVVFLDADDLWHENFLDTTVTQLDQVDDDVVGVGSGWVYTDQDGKELSHTRMSRTGYLGLHDFLVTNPFPIHAILTRREALLSVDGFDTQILAMEDWDLWLRLIATGGRFCGVQPCLAKYRLHGSTNSRQPDRMRAGRLRALEKLFARNDLPLDIQLLKPRIMGQALIQSSVELYAVQRDAEALGNFCQAVRLSPELLEDEDVFFAIICAQQPVGHKSTAQFLHLATGERRLLAAIQASSQSLGVSNTQLLQRAYSRAYLILGRLAYIKREMDITRRYIYLALKSDLGCFYRTNAIWLWAKSLISPRWFEIFRSPGEDRFAKVD
jgi:GT2 family glycosyltransferase